MFLVLVFACCWFVVGCLLLALSIMCGLLCVVCCCLTCICLLIVCVSLFGVRCCLSNVG